MSVDGLDSALSSTAGDSWALIERLQALLEFLALESPLSCLLPCDMASVQHPSILGLHYEAGRMEALDRAGARDTRHDTSSTRWQPRHVQGASVRL